MVLNIYNITALIVFFAIIPLIVKAAEMKNERENCTFEQWAGRITRELIIEHAKNS